MKKELSVLFLLMLLMFMHAPKETSAYLPTHQTALHLDADTILFTITYKFSWLGYGLSMPIGAKRDAPYDAPSPVLGYEVRTSDGTRFVDGEAYSIVLSDAKIMGSEYRVPTSAAEYFTLVTLLNLPDTFKDEKIHLQITKLPFTLIKDDKAERVQLSEDQLKTHRTW